MAAAQALAAGEDRAAIDEARALLDALADDDLRREVGDALGR